MKLSFVTLDVFTSTRYAGNPLAIIHVPMNLRQSLTSAQKQLIAAEFNLSESVFMHETPPDTPGEEVQIDIYTPSDELPFAGHPTIGSAWYLLSPQPQSQQARPLKSLLTRAGPIPVSLGAGGVVRAEIPHNIHFHTQRIATPEALLATTSPPQHPSRDSPIVSIVKGMSFILCALPDLAALARATTQLFPPSSSPDAKPDDLHILDDGWRQGFIGTLYYVAQGRDAQGQRLFRTRMHGGGVEDPATGSASCALAAFVALQEARAVPEGDEGKEKEAGERVSLGFRLVQGVEMGKRSEISVEIEVEVTRDRSLVAEDVKSVVLSGTAVRVMQGELEI